MARRHRRDVAEERTRRVGVAKAEVLREVVRRDLSTHPGESQQGPKRTAEGDTLLSMSVVDGARADRIAGQPEHLLQLVPDGESEGSREAAQTGGPERRPVLGEALQVGVAVHEDDVAIGLERRLQTLPLCREHALSEHSRGRRDQRLVVGPTMRHPSGELHHLISVRCVPAEMNDAGYSAQGTSCVAGVYRADSG